MWVRLHMCGFFVVRGFCLKRVVTQGLGSSVLGCRSTPRRSWPSLLVFYLLQHALMYALGTWNTGAGML